MAKTEYVPVRKDLEYIVHDENDVVVAVVAHEFIAAALNKQFGYGWTSDTSRYVGTNKVGQDMNHLFDAEERKEMGLPPRNIHAVR